MHANNPPGLSVFALSSSLSGQPSGQPSVAHAHNSLRHQLTLSYHLRSHLFTFAYRFVTLTCNFLTHPFALRSASRRCRLADFVLIWKKPPTACPLELSCSMQTQQCAIKNTFWVPSAKLVSYSCPQLQKIHTSNEISTCSCPPRCPQR